MFIKFCEYTVSTISGLELKCYFRTVFNGIALAQSVLRLARENPQQKELQKKKKLLKTIVSRDTTTNSIAS